MRSARRVLAQRHDLGGGGCGGSPAEAGCTCDSSSRAQKRSEAISSNPRRSQAIRSKSTAYVCLVPSRLVAGAQREPRVRRRAVRRPRRCEESAERREQRPVRLAPPEPRRRESPDGLELGAGEDALGQEDAWPNAQRPEGVLAAVGRAHAPLVAAQRPHKGVVLGDQVEALAADARRGQPARTAALPPQHLVAVFAPKRDATRVRCERLQLRRPARVKSQSSGSVSAVEINLHLGSCGPSVHQNGRLGGLPIHQAAGAANGPGEELARVGCHLQQGGPESRRTRVVANAFFVTVVKSCCSTYLMG